MRMFNAWVVVIGVLAGVAAAMVVVFTHEVRLSPAIAAGIVKTPPGIGYDIPRRPSELGAMEAALVGEQTTHFIWWTYLGEMRFAGGDRPGAMRAWQRGAELAIEASDDPAVDANEWQPAYRAGWNLWRLGRQEEAELWMNRALDLFRTRAMRARTGDGVQRHPESGDDEAGSPAFAGVSLWDLHFIGYARRVVGDEAGAIEAFTEMIERRAALTTRRDDGGRYYYTLARLMAMIGNHESALLSFEAAARHRRFSPEDAWWTPSFQTIRDDPRFKAVLEGDVLPGEMWPDIGPPLGGSRNDTPRTFRG